MVSEVKDSKGRLMHSSRSRIILEIQIEMVEL